MRIFGGPYEPKKQKATSSGLLSEVFFLALVLAEKDLLALAVARVHRKGRARNARLTWLKHRRATEAPCS